MNALISASEVDSLLKRTTPYSQRELMQLASFSFTTLADKLSDLSYSEKAVVQRLEGVNLYHYANACRVAIGSDTKGMAALMSSYKYASTISEIKAVAKSESRDSHMETEMYCMLIVKMILSNGDAQFRVKLDGQVPTKLFSFRQTNADEWFDTIIGVYTRIVARVLSLNGVEEAQKLLFMQCAWHMHHSQPSKYVLDAVEGGKLLGLFKQFVTEFGN